jgi:hypothetical protein
VAYLPDYSASLCQLITPVTKLFERSREEGVPTNWTVRSFDFDSMSMIDGVRPNSACECSPRHGLPQWYLHTRHLRFRRMGKREAIYTSAMLRRVTLLRYDSTTEQLVGLAKTPPPEMYARTASMCSGRVGRVEGNALIFREVPPLTAAVLCVAAGQQHPFAQQWRSAVTGMGHRDG